MHIVHNQTGKIIGQWGRRKLSETELQKRTKPRNIHIARQTLRAELLGQLKHDTNILWGHRLKDISYNQNSLIELEFQVGEDTQIKRADLVV